MDIVLIILQLLTLILAVTAVVIALRGRNGNTGEKEEISKLKGQLDLLESKLSDMQQAETNNSSTLRQEINSTINNNMNLLREAIKSQMEAAASAQTGELRSIGESMAKSDKVLEEKTEANNIAQSKLISEMRDSITAKFSDMNGAVDTRLDVMNKSTTDRLKQFEERLRTLETTTDQRLSDIRSTVSKQLSQMAEDNNSKLTKMTEDNNRQLEKIRGTVDEKLQDALDKKISESFKQVSERLEQVYKGLGEMQTIAQGVGDLKNVLLNVKKRGILGEIQLGAILEEILAPEQYETDIATVPKSKERVEFAIRLPGADENSRVYLPIDSKFNGDRYAALQAAYEEGDKEKIAAEKKELFNAIKKCAKDIRDKYIYPPYTTQFAIMFLPFEGLYAEVVNSDLVTTLQRDYNVNIAGPSTMAAMLNSLQMGFKTLAIQKRSGEVWKILGAVKTEFTTFADVLEKTQKHIKNVEDDLDKLVGVRTRQITRKLSTVETLDLSESQSLLSD